MEGLNDLAKKIFENNKEKGFWDKERNVGELLMLVTSELGEAMEAHRKDRFADTQIIDEMVASGYSWQDSTLSFSEAFKKSVKDTFEDELADAIIRLLDMAGGLGIDIEWHIRNKMAFNETRERLHGKKY